MGFTISAKVFYYYVCKASEKILRECVADIGNVQILLDLQDIEYPEEEEEPTKKPDDAIKTYYVGYTMYHSSYKCSEISTEVFPLEYLKDLGEELGKYKIEPDLKVSVKLDMS